jgi:MFS family permease
MQQDRSLSQTTLFKATLLATSTLTVMSGATISPALPQMEDHFEQVEGVAYLVRLVLTMPALFIVFGGPIAGLLADRIGRKTLLVAATILYGLAGSSGFVLSSLGFILVGRAFLGLAVAGVMTAVTTLIADYYAGAARSQFMGTQAAAMGFGGVIFLSLGGWLADMSWRLPFVIYLSALLLLPFILFLLYEPHQPLPHTVKALVTNEPQTLDSDPTDPLDSQSGQLNTLNQSQPAVEPRSHPQRLPEQSPSLLIIIYAIAFGFMTIFYMIPVQLPYYLRSLSGASAAQVGLAIALFNLFSSATALFYGRIKARFNFAIIVALGCFLIGAGYVAIGLASTYALVLIGLAIGGMGTGLMMPNLNVWATIASSPEIRGRALGILTSAYFLGQFTSPFLSTPLSDRLGMDATFVDVGIGLLVAGVALGVYLNRLVTFVDAGNRASNHVIKK